MQMNTSAWVLLIFLSMLWGAAFFFSAIAVKEVPPLTLVLSRVVIAAGVLMAYLWAIGQHDFYDRKLFSNFLVMGLISNVLPFSLIFWAQKTITSSLASILIATTSIFTIVIAHIFLADERMAMNKAAGIGFGVLGVAVLLGSDVVDGADVATLGIVACLGAALLYGCAGVYGRRFAALGVSAEAASCGQLIASTLILLPVVPLVEQPWAVAMPSWPALLSILCLALFSTALAFVVFFHLLKNVGAVNVALVSLLVPVSAVLLGVLVLGERLEMQHVVGMALITIGLVAIDGRLAAKLG